MKNLFFLCISCIAVVSCDFFEKENCDPIYSMAKNELSSISNLSYVSSADLLPPSIPYSYLPLERGRLVEFESPILFRSFLMTFISSNNEVGDCVILESNESCLADTYSYSSLEGNEGGYNKSKSLNLGDKITVESVFPGKIVFSDSTEKYFFELRKHSDSYNWVNEEWMGVKKIKFKVKKDTYLEKNIVTNYYFPFFPGYGNLEAAELIRCSLLKKGDFSCRVDFLLLPETPVYSMRKSKNAFSIDLGLDSYTTEFVSVEFSLMKLTDPKVLLSAE